MPSFPFAGVCTEKPMGREGRDMSLSIFFLSFLVVCDANKECGQVRFVKSVHVIHISSKNLCTFWFTGLRVPFLLMFLCL